MNTTAAKFRTAAAAAATLAAAAIALAACGSSEGSQQNTPETPPTPAAPPTAALSIRQASVEYANSTNSVPPIQVIGGGFIPRELIRLDLVGGTNNPIATQHANESGAVDFGSILIIPSTKPDSGQSIVYTLLATGTFSELNATQPITVTDSIDD